MVIQAEDIPPGVTWRDLTVIKQNNKWLKGLFLLLKRLLTVLRKGGKVMDDRDLPPPQRPQVTCALRTLQHLCGRHHTTSYQAPNPQSLHFKKRMGSSSDAVSQWELSFITSPPRTALLPPTTSRHQWSEGRHGPCLLTMRITSNLPLSVVHFTKHP